MEDFSTSVSADSSSATEISPAGASASNEGYGTDTTTSQPDATLAAPEAAPVADESATEPPDGSAAASPVVPEDDSDLEETGAEGIRSLRQAYRTLESDHRSAKPIVETVEQLGGLDVVVPSTEMVNAIFGDNPVNFWSSLYNESPEATARLVDTVMQTWPDYVMQKAAEMNLIPQATPSPAPVSSPVDPAKLASIPEQFQALYQSLPDEVREEIDLMGEQARDFTLEKYAQADIAARQAAEVARGYEAQREQQFQQAKASLENDLRQAVWSGVEKQLSDKLKFTGDPKTDGMLVGMLRAFAEQELSSDPSVQPISAKTWEHIEKLERRQALGMAAQLQAQAANRLNGYITALDKVFDGYRRFLESQRNEATNRREAPPGTGNAFGQQNGRALPANAGEFNAENLRAISRSIFGG